VAGSMPPHIRRIKDASLKQWHSWFLALRAEAKENAEGTFVIDQTAAEDALWLRFEEPEWIGFRNWPTVLKQAAGYMPKNEDIPMISGSVLVRNICKTFRQQIPTDIPSRELDNWFVELSF
jgi:hypothetical protein